MPVFIKRIYEPFSPDDGYRVLVDRLWPRGVKKDAAKIDLWLKEVAPSATLRTWFNHEPERWDQFLKRYISELKDSAAFAELKQLIGKHKHLTLLYSAKDETYNQAVALQQLLKLHK